MFCEICKKDHIGIKLNLLSGYGLKYDERYGWRAYFCLIDGHVYYSDFVGTEKEAEDFLNKILNLYKENIANEKNNK